MLTHSGAMVNLPTHNSHFIDQFKDDIRVQHSIRFDVVANSRLTFKTISNYILN